MARQTYSGYAASPLVNAAPHDTRVKQFLTAPVPTLIPVDVGGHPALPMPSHMVGGLPFPHSAQMKLAHWNRVSSGPGMPAGVTFNAPKDRMTQT